jgi:hypothetical protein
MGVSPVVFETAGQRTQHYIPGVYTRNAFIKGSGGGVSANVGVILGPSKGGTPDTLLQFASPSEAKATLLDGDLLRGVYFAFNPGASLVPQYVYAMRINAGSQSSGTMKDSVPAIQISLTSVDYGVHTNSISRKFEAGSTLGTYKITIKYGNTDTESWDDITHPSFSVQYTGSGTACVMTLTTSGITTTVDSVADQSISFDTYTTVQDLVDYINTLTNYQATLVTGDGSEKTVELDTVTSSDIKTAAYTVHADLMEIIDTINQSAYVTAAHPSATTTRIVPAVDTAYVYLSGGTSGTQTSTDYENALTALETEDASMIATTSTDEAVHLLIQQHCESMSGTTGKHERMFWVGGSSGETVAATITRAKNLSSEYGNLCFPGFTAYDPVDTDNGISTWSCAMYACKLIGQEMAVSVNEPLTNKQISVLSWEKTLTKTETEKLIAGGVTAGAKDDSGNFITVRAVTTYQGDLLQKNERSMMREALYMSKDFRAAFAGDIGRPQSAVDTGTISSVLKSKAVSWKNSGYIVKGTDHDLIWGITMTEDGDALFVEYHVYLTAPRNFIFGTANLHVLSETVAL